MSDPTSEWHALTGGQFPPDSVEPAWLKSDDEPWPPASHRERETVMALRAELEQAQHQRDEAEQRLDKLRTLVGRPGVAIDDVIRILEGINP